MYKITFKYDDLDINYIYIRVIEKELFGVVDE